ncbi:MAG: peptide chain release factor N(5)-glutamine methyltransferase [Thermonemataceae bacterium]
MSLNVKSLFDQSLQFLKEHHSNYEKGEAEAALYWLLEHFFGLSKTDVLANKSFFYEDHQHVYEQSLQRLVMQEPIQYIIGEAYFYGRKFNVSPDVLIPRPETEELVAWLLTNTPVDKPLRILDVGTGSGCIAITLAKYLPKAQVYALDVSAKALQITEENARSHQVTLVLVETDILHTDFSEQDFDVIVSNPPYVAEAEKAAMDDNVLEYEPHLALFVPDDKALVFYEAIAQFAKVHLRKGGALYFELNARFAKETEALMKEIGFQSVQIKEDMQGKQRFLKAQKP